jgi:hypothetical protein
MSNCRETSIEDTQACVSETSAMAHKTTSLQKSKRITFISNFPCSDTVALAMETECAVRILVRKIERKIKLE